MGELVRNQNPPLQKTNVKNARWFIRPYVDRLQPDGSVKRERERIYLGSCSEMDRKSAGVQRAEPLGRINNGSYVLQSQINFGEFLDLFEKKFVEAKDNLAASTQAKYAAHLKNHIRPAFGHLAIGEITTLRIDDWLAAKAGDAGLSWFNPQRSPQSDELHLPPSKEMGCLEAGQPGSTRKCRPQADGAGEEKKLAVADTRRLLLRFAG